MANELKIDTQEFKNVASWFMDLVYQAYNYRLEDVNIMSLAFDEKGEKGIYPSIVIDMEKVPKNEMVLQVATVIGWFMKGVLGIPYIDIATFDKEKTIADGIVFSTKSICCFFTPNYFEVEEHNTELNEFIENKEVFDMLNDVCKVYKEKVLRQG